MAELFMLNRVLALGNQCTVAVPLKLYDNKKAALDGASLRTQALQSFMHARLVDDQGDMGMNVGQFLQQLGVEAFDHVVQNYGVHAGDLIAQPPPPPSLIYKP